MAARERLVMVGNGMAGMAFIEKLLEEAPDRYDITVFGEEPHPNYNRILLSSALASETDWTSLTLHSMEWYEVHEIHLQKGVRVEEIRCEEKVVVDRQGRRTPYDTLVLATGSRAFVPPIPGLDKEGVHVFRTLEDCREIQRSSKTSAGTAAVIGGGLLGLEAARGLKDLGMKTTVVHLAPWLMERQLDAPAGAALFRALQQQGIHVRLSAETVEIYGGQRVEGLRLKCGTEIDADVLVVAAGITPNTELAQTAGIRCNRGIVVSDIMLTSDPDIFALGECCEHRGVCYGLVAPLYEQAAVLAGRLSGSESSSYHGSHVATKLKVSGVDVFSAGNIEDDVAATVLRFEDTSRGVYRKTVVKDERLVGAILVGDVSSAALLQDLVMSGRPLNGEVESLFGLGNGNLSADEASPYVDTLSDDAIVCGCNGVTKGEIVQAIDEGDLRTRKEVAACTNASRSCGGCGALVDQLLASVHGESAALPPEKTPLCDCTTLSRDEIVAAIGDRKLLSVRKAMAYLEWTTEGCARCRPAINYFILMRWPGEHEDDPQSRFVNERVHANVQRDGTYSVVPRMYGGVTTPDELERIAAVARKYDVPLLKVTGGQRIDLLGIAKEDLPAIWEELDMPSGFAYAKAVRTVKTCVGSDFCRFGTRDSVGLGIRIEKTFEGLWTPAKVKMAVNACPRNCAESLIKDVGLIAVDLAWEIYVGGNGGVKVRVGERLCSVEDDDEVLEIIAAFLQVYREEADYNQRTSAWCAAVGIDYLRERVVEDTSSRAELVARMKKALAYCDDPWRMNARKLKERDPEVLREYRPLDISTGPQKAPILISETTT